MARPVCACRPTIAPNCVIETKRHRCRIHDRKPGKQARRCLSWSVCLMIYLEWYFISLKVLFYIQMLPYLYIPFVVFKFYYFTYDVLRRSSIRCSPVHWLTLQKLKSNQHLKMIFPGYIFPQICHGVIAHFIEPFSLFKQKLRPRALKNSRR